MQFENLAGLYQYFDELVEHGASSDELFASSYIRGFVSLAACQFGDESQPLSSALATIIADSITQARSELSPADRVIVNDYWQALKVAFAQ